MSADELTNWMAFAVEEPFGDARADYRNAILCTAVVNSQGAKRKPSDFMPFTKAHMPQAPAAAPARKRPTSPVADSVFAAMGVATKRTKVVYTTSER